MRRTCFALCLIVPGHCLAARVAPGDALFASDDVFALTLTGPLRTIARDHGVDAKFQPAELSFVETDGVAHSIKIGLRARGKSRRNPDACNFPPLRLDFPKQGTEGTVFAGQNKLKLVTQCHARDSTHEYEQYLLKEYVLYHVFNRLSEFSFRVRLVHATYRDSDSDKKLATSFAFFIEDKDDPAKRTALSVTKVKEISRAALDPVQTNRVELFQYMIGNTDFSLLRGPADEECCHNMVPLQAADGKYRPVPYDFDATGVVDPPYAIPVEELKLDNVKVRLYRGRCDPAAVFDQTLTEFKAARADILALFQRQPDLSERTINTAVNYLERFYAIIDDSKRLDREILRVCRK